jgi:hypothetical protein
MPPKQLLTLGPPLKTRAGNKDKHPGIPDVTKPRRKPAEVEQSHQETAKRRQEKENIQRGMIEDIAELEDRLQEEDEERERQRVERYKANLQKNS